MNITIIDGQGGRLGAQLVKEITTRFPDAELTAIGTNAAASAGTQRLSAMTSARSILKMRLLIFFLLLYSWTKSKTGNVLLYHVARFRRKPGAQPVF